ncbi:ABC transporter permease [Paenibacillus sp. GCM10027626]|uniref:ABC transporter permease n=1 Tax=Paenibacillus sp. GCM10027626 TaxID=3273411 RepID=UPI0036412971
MSRASMNHSVRSWRSKLINPVIGKEFRLRMRTPRSMWSLFFYLLAIGVFAFGFIYVTTVLSSQNSAVFDPNRSQIMFYFITAVQLGLVAFMAPGLTAGVISGEREKQTLNLLLTTQQSSTTIIVSKLVASLSFMLLLVAATLPVYSVVFLYGGISPREMLLVFLFFIFLMIVLGSLGIMFSTLFKRTMVSVIVTYGVTLFIFAGTGFLYLIMEQIMAGISRNSASGALDYGWVGHFAAFNPVAALVSIFEPDVTSRVFHVSGGQYHWPLWTEFVIIYLVLSLGAIMTAIRYIRPNYRRKAD